MKSTFAEQGSQNAQRWAQQKKEQMERARNNSKEGRRTNLTQTAEMSLNGQRGSSLQGPSQNRPQSQQEIMSNQLRLLKSKQQNRQQNQAVQEVVKQTTIQQFQDQQILPPRSRNYPNPTMIPKQPDQDTLAAFTRQNKPPQPVLQNQQSQQQQQKKLNNIPQRQASLREDVNTNPYNSKTQAPANQSQQAPQPNYQAQQQRFNSNKNQNTNQNMNQYMNENMNSSALNPHDEAPAFAQGKPNLPPVDPYEEEFDESELVECPEGCGRKFNPNSIEKHIRICQKVFQQKRKKFDTKEQRILNNEHLNLLKQAEVQEKVQEKKMVKQTQVISTKRNPKWKAQSLAFRAMLKNTKGLPVSQEDQCDFCGRKFNEKTAEKHIPFCENKTKLNKIKQGPPPPQRKGSKKY